VCGVDKLIGYAEWADSKQRVKMAKPKEDCSKTWTSSEVRALSARLLAKKKVGVKRIS